ncbi:hypothetical protein [Pandoraea norimbergensis]|uniref:Uncharacterized protein n=1 Tax=Pandoraea norimbergensis TaxID=93219 RepID=A0ABN4JIP4_9BURK|nr:hypothetical protein [Pandoraea norimbergensis]ALS59905.1 hypothetical protein AT302_09200 [Pandoraea norimbergensis]
MEGEGKTPLPADGSRCPQCGSVVSCGAQSTEVNTADAASACATTVTCWCLDWPHLPASARLGVGACLCPPCLRAALVAAGVSLSGTPADLTGSINDAINPTTPPTNKT